MKRNLQQLLGLAVFAQLCTALSTAVACDAPEGRFCVDFYKGKNPEGQPLISRKAPYIKYDWAHRSPARRVPYDHFSARWRGKFQFGDEAYAFRVSADDGVRVKLDGRIVIDRWNDGFGGESTTEIRPGAGIHLVEVEYFDETGEAYLAADWKPVAAESGDDFGRAEAAAPVSTTPLPHEPVAAEQSKAASIPAVFRPGGIDRKRKQAPLGINLSAFNYWSSSVPFKDLLMQNGKAGVYQAGTNKPCRQQTTFDADGYPLDLPSACVFRIWSAFHITDDDLWPGDTLPYQPGRYVLTYQGHGRINLGWDAKNVVQIGDGRIEFEVPNPDLGIQVEVTGLDTADPIRDMHMVQIADEASYEQQPFNERWLDLLRPFNVIRFKDWGRMDQKITVYNGKALVRSPTSLTLLDTPPAENERFNDRMVALVNVAGKWPRMFVDHYDAGTRTLYLKTPIESPRPGIEAKLSVIDFVNQSWPERATPTTLGQASDKGIAFETMMQLANTLEADPWISIPTAADDAFVEKLAELIKTRLNPGLKCYIEYSNETWNFSYPGYYFSEAKMRQLGLSGTVVPADAWQSYRAVEIFKIFNRVFGEADLREKRTQSRLVRVLTSQTAWLDRSVAVMDWTMPDKAWPTEGMPAHKFADAWAGTAYFGINDKKDRNVLERASMKQLIEAQIDDIDAMFGSASQPGMLRRLLMEATARSLQFVIYEGGTEILAPKNKPDLVEKAARVNQDPRMRTVYDLMFRKWARLQQEFGADAVGVWTQYHDVGHYGKFGYWGLLQSTYQDAAAVPKYQAILDYVSGP